MTYRCCQPNWYCCKFVQRDFTSLMCLCDATGLHVFPTFVLYELTILLVLTLTLVIMKVRHLCLFSSFTPSHPALTFIPLFPPLPVHDGCTGAVGHLASMFSTHTVGCLSRSGSGQRVLLRLEQPCSSCRHHLQRGQ